MNSCSTGSVARLPSRFSRTTRSRKNGDKTGAFRSIAGAPCAPTIFNGGANGCAATRRIFHLFRIDHVQGFYRIYAFPWRPERNKEFLPLDQHQMLERTGGRAPHFVPRDDDTPEHREANKREGEEYLRVVLEEAGAARVAGEDLGVVPDYVRPSLRSLGIAGFKIPQWEMRDGMIIPGEMYERLSVATYATHDHEPIRALWEEALKHSELRDGTTSARDTREDRAFCRIEFQNRPARLRERFLSRGDGRAFQM